MKITEAIEEFKRILKIFKENNQNSTFLCHNSNKEEFISLFNSNNAYYKNYVIFGTLLTPFKSYTNKEKQWKINFMKQEIKELTILLKQGYTDI